MEKGWEEKDQRRDAGFMCLPRLAPVCTPTAAYRTLGKAKARAGEQGHDLYQS